MKRLDITIPHEYLVDINQILHKHRVGGMTFYDIKGRGKTKNEPVAVGRSSKRYVPEFGYHTKIEVIVSNELAKTIIRDVLNMVSDGSSATGKIFVYDVEEIYDLASGEKGESAL
jgi:nitrogen regulatory protein P-II 1